MYFLFYGYRLRQRPRGKQREDREISGGSFILIPWYHWYKKYSIYRVAAYIIKETKINLCYMFLYFLKNSNFTNTVTRRKKIRD